VAAGQRGRADRTALSCRSSSCLLDWGSVPRLGVQSCLPGQAPQTPLTRYEHGSIILTTNRCIASWGEIFDDTTVAAAILDRLLHHATVLQIDGDSYRMRGHRARLTQLRAGLNQGGEFSRSQLGIFRRSLTTGRRCLDSCPARRESVGHPSRRPNATAICAWRLATGLLRGLSKPRA
jgi:IstB-like ATP binding protein